MNHKLADSIRVLRYLTPFKVLNYVLLSASYWISIALKKELHTGMPVSLSVEPSNACNLKCVECKIGQHELSRAGGNMTLDLFESVLLQTSKSLMNLTLYFQGEPFLNTDLYAMIKLAHEKKIYSVVSTNGHFLTDENCRKIIESKLDRLIISLDGLDDTTYTSYRQGGDVEKVKLGIGNIIKWRNHYKTSYPLIIIQTLVLKTNEHQLKSIKEYSKQIGADSVSFKTAQLYTYKQGNPLMPVNEKFSRYKKLDTNKFVLKKTISNKCWRLWSSTVITWNGIVVPCCYDKDSLYSMGDLTVTNFNTIWKSSTYKDFRKQILSNRKQIDICTNCNE